MTHTWTRCARVRPDEKNASAYGVVRRLRIRMVRASNELDRHRSVPLSPLQPRSRSTQQ